jgi:hypothetical protein
MPRRAIFAAAAALLLAAPGLAVAKNFSDWGAASVVPNVNSGAADGCPIESPNGLRLFFASNRDPVGGAADTNDIWMASRQSEDAAFGAPVRLPAPVNSASADFCPTPLTADRLLFVSARAVAGACGAGDIYLTRNHPARGWEIPTNLGCSAAGAGPNSAGGEFSPSLVETAQGTFLYYSSPGAGGLQDIYVSAMQADGTFAPGTPVAGINTASTDQMPNVRRDGLEMVFVSDRHGAAGQLDVYVSTRASTSDAWGTPQQLGSTVNTAAPESRPSLSADGERLYFGRAGDIWVSTRVHQTGP